jgi:hypothetical protein
MRQLAFSAGVYLTHLRTVCGFEDWEWVKVGSSRDLVTRLGCHHVVHGGSKILHLIECPSIDAARGLESMLHAALVKRGRARRSVDYFRFDHEDVRWLRSMDRFEEAMLEALKAIR